MSATTESPAREHPSVHPDLGFFRLLQSVGYIMVWIALFSIAAGRATDPRGWISAGGWFLAMLALGWIVHLCNPPLLPIRGMHFENNRFDKVLAALFLPLTLLLPAAAGLEVRCHRTPLPFWNIYPALALLLLAMSILLWTAVVNRSAGPSTSRSALPQQRIVRTGPYRRVRHPLATGSVLLYPAIAWMLGSPWALIVAAVIDGLIIVRAAREDRTCLKNVPHYCEYAAAIPWRMFPGLW